MPRPTPLTSPIRTYILSSKRSASGRRAGTWAAADLARPRQDVIRDPGAHPGHPEPLPVVT